MPRIGSKTACARHNFASDFTRCRVIKHGGQVNQQSNMPNLFATDGAPAQVYMLSADDLTRVMRDMFARFSKEREREAETADTFISREEVAKLLKVSYPTLWRWSVSGYLTPVKVGSRVLYRKKDVAALTGKKGGAL